MNGTLLSRSQFFPLAITIDIDDINLSKVRFVVEILIVPILTFCFVCQA